MRDLSDDDLMRLFRRRTLTIAYSRAPKASFGRRLYSEMLTRFRGEPSRFKGYKKDISDVANFAIAHGVGAFRLRRDRTDRELILPVEAFPLDGRPDLPAYISKPADRRQERSEFGLRRAHNAQVLFRGDQYAVILDGKEMDARSLYVPLKAEFKTASFTHFDRCLFAGTMRSSQNISHFVFDTLPRVLLANDLHDFDTIVLSPPSKLSSYQRYLIDLFGLNVVLLPEGSSLSADELFFFDNVGNEVVGEEGGLSHPANFCHRTLLDRIEVDPPAEHRPEKVYISRFDAPERRPLVNERELADALERRGFMIVTPTEWHPSQQIAFFRNAKVIVGPHGAGLTGVFAARPGTTLVELFPPKATAAYASVAVARGLDYRHVEGTAEPGHLRYSVAIDAVLGALDAPPTSRD